MQKKFSWNLRLILDKEKCHNYNITPEDISEKINTKWGDAICVFSPPYDCCVDIYIDTSGITVEAEGFIKEENKEVCHMMDVVIPELEKMYVRGVEGVYKTYPKCNFGCSQI